MTARNPILLSILITIILSLTSSHAYRIGDAVGILLRTSHTSSSGVSTLDAYRHQMPRFGVSTKTRFDVSSLFSDDIKLAQDVKEHQPMVDRWTRTEHDVDSERVIRMSISFDEGFHHIPWLDIYNKHHRKVLEKLIITFVYSGSDGSIHAVHREARYTDADNSSQLDHENDLPKSFVVEYIWIEEADVDARGGVLMLFLCVLCAVFGGMIGECSASESPRRREKGGDTSFWETSSEGFTKRL
ncbi:hypothetical protein HJC23_006554 [Cyclotella cryptica]|uniref:Uncharacterized protein n=1 Tax=Cyclotella cryptica TaxID=29204 RepID=A0ABD3PL92_9STRA|eukprot:CCRYP_013629-RA/>CCRYP_013629-RA protein AED:0.42 eAED:0.42 QI:0/-1/0/1/-1/1/1/0/242